MPVARKPHFVMNQLGQSADRRGPFESLEAAEYWAENHYGYPAWTVPAAPAGKGKGYRLLDRDGNPVTPEE